MKLKKSNSFLSPISGILLLAFTCSTALQAAELVKWDIPVSVSSPSAGSEQGVPSLGTGIAGASPIALTGCVTGTTSSLGWRWYDGSGPATDLDSALAQNNFFAFNVTASNVYQVVIDGLGRVSFNKGGSSPSSLALLYSATNTWTAGNFRIISTDVAVPTTVADLSAALAGDLGSTPISLGTGETGYFRIAYWGASSTNSGTILHANSIDGNDLSLLGTATPTVIVKNLLWTGAGGSDWNTAPGNTNWADTGNGSAPAAFSSNDNATISSAASITVDSGGITAGSVTVNHASGTVALADGSLTAESLVKSNAGTLVLTSENSFSAGITLSGGVTEIGVEGALGTTLINLSGATLRADPAVGLLANGIVLGSGGGIIENAGSLSISGISNSTANNPLVKNGGGDLVVTGALGLQTTGALNLTVSAGSVDLSGSAQANLGASVTLGGNLILNGPTASFHGSTVNRPGSTGAIVFRSASAVLASRLNAGTVSINVPVVLESDGRIDSANGNNTLNLNAGVSGNFNLTKSGNGNANLNQPSTYTGTTTINGNGTLRLGNLGTLGLGDVAITASAARLSFGIAADLTLPNLISGAGGIYLAPDSIGAVTFSNNASSYTGPTNIAGSELRVTTLADGGLPSSIGASSSDSANLLLSGGTLVYQGAAPAATDREFSLGIGGGGLSASGAGTVDFTNPNSIAMTDPAENPVGALTIGSTYQIIDPGTTDFTLIGAADSSPGTVFVATGPGTGTGTVVFAAARALRLGGSTPGVNTLAAFISDGSYSPTALVKNGTTTWSITSDNIYTGPTNINAGTLRIDGPSPDTTGIITVAATGRLGGNGLTGAPVVVQSGGGLAAKISSWTGGVAGTDYDDLTVASLDAGSVPMTVVVDSQGLAGFTESAASFTILNAPGGISGFSPANVTVSAPGFPGTGSWSLEQSGTSLVLSYALAGADPYQDWATGAPYNLAGNNALPGADPDKDGIDNGVEFVIGGNPATGSDTAKLPVAVISGSNLVFTFRRSNQSAYLNPSVQYGSTLTGWATAQNGVGGVTITVSPEDIEPGIKSVTVTIPQALAGGPKLFTRLNVTVP